MTIWFPAAVTCLSFEFPEICHYKQDKGEQMKAGEAACAIKVGILICGHEIGKPATSAGKGLFLSIFSHSVFPPQPFAIPLQAKQRHTWPFYFISLSWRKNECESRCFVNVSPLSFWFVRRQRLWTQPRPRTPSPPKVQIPCSPRSELGTEGKEQIDTDILRVFSVSHFCQVWQLIKLK